MAVGAILDLPGLQALIDVLRGRGYRVMGPTVRDGVIALGDIAALDDLPRGTGDVQEPGHYRTLPRDDGALFGFAAPAQSAKPLTFPSDETLWQGTRVGAGFDISPEGPGGAVTPDGPTTDGPWPDGPTRQTFPAHPATTTPADLAAGQAQGPGPVALIGIRGCDLAAIGIHDSILLRRSAIDAHYAARRGQAFIVAVTCGSPGGTCFCDSMGTGPKPGAGADLTLTELMAPHRFLVETGSPAGEEVLAVLPSRATTPTDLSAADAVVVGAVARMGRALRTDDLRDLLYASAESPRWNDVATRCLACTNCTLVCPTCFCTSVEDVSDLSGDIDVRHRVWDSCFSMEYSRLHGGAVRTSIAARYRQWLTHKLGAWIDQFGMSGCVGCGRCITWCPVGIDLTEEVVGLRAAASTAPSTGTAAGPTNPAPTSPAPTSPAPSA